MAAANRKNGLSPKAIFNRLTRGDFLDAWNGVKNMARHAMPWQELSYDRYEDRDALAALVHECIVAKGGDVSARARTVELGTVYLHLSLEGRERFQDILARDFDTDRQLVAQRMKALESARGEDDIVAAEIALQEALEPRRLKLLRQFSALPNGFKFLIDMRADVLSGVSRDTHRYKLSLDLKKILSSWFDVSLLDLQEITWNSPAAVLEKLIQYEAVHEIHSWEDLRKRLDSDRLCFAFFHSKMPLEPLIFVEVALVDGLSDNIQGLLEKEDGTTEPAAATTAIFYSISNTQQGLAGISLGNFLIKTVVERLSRQQKQLRQFATLSPVPGFRAWLEPKLAEGDETVLLPGEHETVLEHCSCPNAVTWLENMLTTKGWHEDRSVTELVRQPLLRLCTRYLLEVKKGSKAIDPVANFHLSNGARLERINWLADVSKQGMDRSYGIMVNYEYRLSEIEQNHEAYVTDGTITAARAVRALLSP